jgi:protocatechuate 3,4-dioxygenase beta subunit
MSRPPAFRGRRLPKPFEPVYDQGLAFDLGTLMDRRRLLRVATAGAVAAGLAACTRPSAPSATTPGAPSPAAPSPSAPAAASTAPSPSGTAAEIPAETAGPFPGDGSNGPDALETSGVVRSDVRSSFGDANGTAAGVPLTLELTVSDLSGGGPFTGAAVYVWQCDREGRYSMYSDGVSGENFLRGVQIADGNGRVRFTTIFPGCYPGRWPHIHFEIYPNLAAITDDSLSVITSQLAVPEAACGSVYQQQGYEQSAANLSRLTLAGDMVFGEDEAASQTATMTGDVRTGLRAALGFGVRP